LFLKKTSTTKFYIFFDCQYLEINATNVSREKKLDIILKSLERKSQEEFYPAKDKISEVFRTGKKDFKEYAKKD
jgi:hypothetical protein